MFLTVVILAFFAAMILAVPIAILVVIAQGQARKDAWRMLDQPGVGPEDIKNVVKRLGRARDNESKELTRKLMDRLTSA